MSLPTHDRLIVRFGNAPGESFRIKVDGGELAVDARSGHVIDGHVEKFERVAVLSGGEGRYRFFEIEPGENEEDIRFGQFFVLGRVRFVGKVNNPQKARAAWKKFARRVESGRAAPVSYNQADEVTGENLVAILNSPDTPEERAALEAHPSDPDLVLAAQARRRLGQEDEPPPL